MFLFIPSIHFIFKQLVWISSKSILIQYSHSVQMSLMFILALRCLCNTTPVLKKKKKKREQNQFLILVKNTLFSSVEVKSREYFYNVTVFFVWNSLFGFSQTVLRICPHNGSRVCRSCPCFFFFVFFTV